jgi:hypothetical protein
MGKGHSSHYITPVFDGKDGEDDDPKLEGLLTELGTTYSAEEHGQTIREACEKKGVDGKQLRLTKESFIEWYLVFRFEMTFRVRVSKRTEEMKTISTAGHSVVASSPTSFTLRASSVSSKTLPSKSLSSSSAEKKFPLFGERTLVDNNNEEATTTKDPLLSSSTDKLITELMSKYQLTEEDVEKEDIVESISEAKKSWEKVIGKDKDWHDLLETSNSSGEGENDRKLEELLTELGTIYSAEEHGQRIREVCEKKGVDGKQLRLTKESFIEWYIEWLYIHYQSSSSTRRSLFLSNLSNVEWKVIGNSQMNGDHHHIWECPVCAVQNPSLAMNCSACGEPVPAAFRLSQPSEFTADFQKDTDNMSVSSGVSSTGSASSTSSRPKKNNNVYCVESPSSRKKAATGPKCTFGSSRPSTPIWYPKTSNPSSPKPSKASHVVNSRPSTPKEKTDTLSRPTTPNTTAKGKTSSQPTTPRGSPQKGKTVVHTKNSSRPTTPKTPHDASTCDYCRVEK